MKLYKLNRIIIMKGAFSPRRSADTAIDWTIIISLNSNSSGSWAGEANRTERNRRDQQNSSRSRKWTKQLSASECERNAIVYIIFIYVNQHMYQQHENWKYSRYGNYVYTFLPMDIIISISQDSLSSPLSDCDWLFVLYLYVKSILCFLLKSSITIRI